MRFLRRLIFGLLFTYVLFWGGLAVYFSYAETHKELLESNLSNVFKRPVTIDQVKTVWRGVSPRIQITGFKVEGDLEGQPAFAFDSLSTELSPVSLLRFWPRFTEFALEKPVLEVVSTENGKLQIAGIQLSGHNQGPVNTERIFSWLLDQNNGVWHDGEVVWRRPGSDARRFKGISFVYQRQQEARSIQATVNTDKGPLAFTAKAQGNPLSDKLWDASLEVLGEGGQRLLTSDDLFLRVDSGKGRLTLKTLDVERIRDFVRLAGLSNEASWILDANLKGRLHDFEFEFSGPLLKMDDWKFTAAASEVEFDSVKAVPGMNNLRGKLHAAASGGKFEFVTQDSRFKWQRWFDREFPIRQASGQLTWQREEGGGIIFSLIDGSLEDDHAKISKINASCRLDTSAQKIESFAQLFKVDSVAELSYEDGQLVDSSETQSLMPLILNASAEFQFDDLSKLTSYLPNDSRIDKFRKWSSKAFQSGKMYNGVASYQGEISRNALRVGKAQLDASADFDEVIVDFGYQRNWPRAEKGRGKVKIENELLTISPDELWFNGDAVTESQLQIADLFQLKRLLTVRGKTSTSLVKGVDFLFKGPLIKPENKLEKLPVIAREGRVDIETFVELPLNKINDAKVNGTAQIRKGEGLLPSGVPVSNINGSVAFTERSVTSNNIKATFLGGQASGTLVTTKAAQPPVVKVTASGVAKVDELEPWVGEHMLTWFEGSAPWQGELLIDGGRIELSASSDLEGVTVSAPKPLAKQAIETAKMNLSMKVGGKDVQQELLVSYRDKLQIRLQANDPSESGSSLFDNCLISVGDPADSSIKPGVNFSISDDDISIDDWLRAIIDLASYTPKKPTNNTAFLDAMRSVKISAKNSFLLGRYFGAMELSTVSVDGFNWIGTVKGDNIEGTMQFSPRSDVGSYAIKLARLDLVDPPKPDAPPAPVDHSLNPEDYPEVSLQIETLRVSGKNIGRLVFNGRPNGREWTIEEMTLKHNGIGTVARGSWQNTKDTGSVTSFDFATVIDEAGGALTDMDFDGIIRKGEGSIDGNLNWQGAPHEFDYARLNGEFDLRLKDGELVNVEPGSGKLLGLLNFNAIARRLVLDFRDVFAAGLKFDRMQYTGLIADGEAIFRQAYIFTPAVFVRMEGKLDLGKELIDMEVHISPELGGNLALLSALANPTAGAVVYLTQRIFKDEMRESNFISYRALGTWKDFEMVELKSNEQQAESERTESGPTESGATENGLDNAAKNGSADEQVPSNDKSELSSELRTP